MSSSLENNSNRLAVILLDNVADYFGINGKFFLQEWVRHFAICIAVSVHVPQPHQQKMYANAITELFKDKRAKVIVCFCDGVTITNLYHEIREQNLTGNFMIIGR